MDAEEASAQKNQNWGYYEAQCLVETWADEEIQRQLSAMGRKQNIWESIAAKRHDDTFEYKHPKLNKQAWKFLKVTSDAETMYVRWNMFP